MTAPSIFSSNTRSKEKDIVSATKAIIETYILSTCYYNYSRRIIEKTTIRVHYTTETISELIGTYINFQKAGFH